MTRYRNINLINSIDKTSRFFTYKFIFHLKNSFGVRSNYVVEILNHTLVIPSRAISNMAQYHILNTNGFKSVEIVLLTSCY